MLVIVQKGSVQLTQDISDVLFTSKLTRWSVFSLLNFTSLSQYFTLSVSPCEDGKSSLLVHAEEDGLDEDVLEDEEDGDATVEMDEGTETGSEAVPVDTEVTVSFIFCIAQVAVATSEGSRTEVWWWLVIKEVTWAMLRYLPAVSDLH